MDIDTVNKTPHKQLTDDDFRQLKSGHDQYSRMTHEQLFQIVPAQAAGQVRAARLNHADAMIALRWIARGLEASKALRKVAADNLYRELCYGELELGEDHFVSGSAHYIGRERWDAHIETQRQEAIADATKRIARAAMRKQKQLEE